MGRKRTVHFTRETIEYRGVPWHRYPESERESSRSYYMGSINKKANSLHRQIWEDYHGQSIPKGREIHHKDFDHNNNAIDNLVCLTKGEHSALHRRAEKGKGRTRSIEHKEAVSKAARRDSRTQKGKESRSRGGKTSLKNREVKKKFCIICQKEYKTKSYNSKFCSKNCQNIWHKENNPKYKEWSKSKDYSVPEETRQCIICKEDFKTSKYKKVKTCSRKCTESFKREKRIERELQAMGLRLND